MLEPGFIGDSNPRNGMYLGGKPLFFAFSHSAWEIPTSELTPGRLSLSIPQCGCSAAGIAVYADLPQMNINAIEFSPPRPHRKFLQIIEFALDEPFS